MDHDSLFGSNDTKAREQLALDKAADIIGHDLVTKLSERGDKTLALVVQLRTGRLVERIRRHLEGLTFKSTFNKHRINALAALVARLRSELAPLLQKAQAKLIQLEFAERELEAYRAAEREIAAERAVKERTGLYAEPAQFVDLLYKHHGIHRGNFAALTDDDVRAIANILRVRSEPLESEEALQQAPVEARAF